LEATVRLVATEYVSLDGVFHEPGQWSHPFFNEEASYFKWAELQASDALLLGRKTYEGFAAAWPGMREATGDFGATMNDMKKYVISSTLTEATWSGSRLIRGNVLDEVRKLKQLPGQDLLLEGSGLVFRALLRENLIDRYRLMVHPIVLGTGARLFADGASQKALTLVATTAFKSGIVIMEYEPSAGA
jgi:dihydrofolate reductase